MAKLIVIVNGKSHEYPVAGALSIGRKSGNDIVISENYVSRHHARIVPHGPNEYTLEDLTGPQGVGLMVNGHKIQRHILRHLDKIEILEVQIVFEEPVPADEALTIVPAKPYKSTVASPPAPAPRPAVPAQRAAPLIPAAPAVQTVKPPPPPAPPVAAAAPPAPKQPDVAAQALEAEFARKGTIREEGGIPGLEKALAPKIESPASPKVSAPPPAAKAPAVERPAPVPVPAPPVPARPAVVPAQKVVPPPPAVPKEQPVKPRPPPPAPAAPPKPPPTGDEKDFEPSMVGGSDSLKAFLAAQRRGEIDAKGSPVQPAQPAPAASSQSNKLLMLVLALLAIVVLGGGAIVFILLRSDQARTQTQPQTQHGIAPIEAKFSAGAYDEVVKMSEQMEKSAEKLPFEDAEMLRFLKKKAQGKLQLQQVRALIFEKNDFIGAWKMAEAAMSVYADDSDEFVKLSSVALLADSIIKAYNQARDAERSGDAEQLKKVLNDAQQVQQKWKQEQESLSRLPAVKEAYEKLTALAQKKSAETAK